MAAEDRRVLQCVAKASRPLADLHDPVFEIQGGDQARGRRRAGDERGGRIEDEDGQALSRAWFRSLAFVSPLTSAPSPPRRASRFRNVARTAGDDHIYDVGKLQERVAGGVVFLDG